jgi:hypothetical protein
MSLWRLFLAHLGLQAQRVLGQRDARLEGVSNPSPNCAVVSSSAASLLGEGLPKAR